MGRMGLLQTRRGSDGQSVIRQNMLSTGHCIDERTEPLNVLLQYKLHILDKCTEFVIHGYT